VAALHYQRGALGCGLSTGRKTPKSKPMPAKGMDPNQFHHVFVKEDYCDWKREPDSLRKAMHLA
jgi:hypothetical protein